jgi:formylglycine-generating enzyme
MKKNGLSALLTSAIIVILFSFFAVSCTDDSSPTRPSIKAEINGTVTDADTGGPVTGVMISLQPSGRSMLTGSDGYYSFAELDADIYTLSVTRSGYAPASTSVKAGFGETRTADIQISSKMPVLKIDTYMLNFGSTLTTLNILISNAGVGELIWSAAPTESWVSLNTTGGVINSGSVAVSVKIDRTGMAAGNYSLPLTFTSNSNSETAEIFAFVSSSTQPQLTVYPTVMDFTKFGIETAFSVENTGIGTLNWNLTDDSSWLECSPISGSTLSGSVSKVNIYINRAGLEPGIYTGKVSVSSGYGSQEITIIMEASDDPNSAPVIVSLKADPVVVLINGSSVISCIAYDPDAEQITYKWSSSSGSISGSGSSEIWTAPMTPDSCTVTCTVSDGKDSTVCTVKISVRDTPNSPPVINSLTASSYSVMQGKTAEISCVAVDQDGDGIYYTWTCDRGSIGGTGDSELWTAPLELDSCTVTCTVSDGISSVSKSIKLEVIPAPNRPPVISYLAADPSSVLTDNDVTMTCVASDADGDSLIYEWSCDGGIINGNGAVEIWTAPSAAGFYTITCTASDGTDTDTENKVVEVTASPNARPVINFLTAEPDTVLIKGSSVFLCSASDPEGDELTYLWSCTDGYINGTDSTETWHAPEKLGQCVVTCAVSDGTNTVIRSKAVFVTDNTKHIQGGYFEMGDRLGEGNADELPVHNVTLSSFNIGIYEVTQSEWERYMPSKIYDYGTGDSYPVYNVTWYEILVYCNKRSIVSGLTPCYSIDGNTDPDAWGAIPASADSVWSSVVFNPDAGGYRLPTESEWEYAARGGIYNTDNYRYSGGESIDICGWYIGNYFPGDFSRTTGLKQPNQLGLYDMSGNVFEWCWDRHGIYTSDSETDPAGPETGDQRVLRGGYWNSTAGECRISYRKSCLPETALEYYGGFRIVRKP